MALTEHAHLQRDRAESFGAIAADYDRFRPSYPAALIDDLAALRPSSVLDIGCGTGKASVLLAARGLGVLGLEPDPQMAAVARVHGLEVEVAGFEAWDDRGRTFELITSAQAWHWIDPVLGAAKAARLLTGGGTLALFWNFDEPDARWRAVVDDVYARLEPALRSSVASEALRRDTRPYVSDLRASGAFAEISTRTYAWERIDTVDTWIARIGTHSDHLALGSERLAQLQAGMRSALGGNNAAISSRGGTYAIWAQVLA